MLLKTYLFILYLGFAPVAMGMISPMEKNLRREVKKAFPAALRQLEEVVNMNSGTFNLEGVRQVGRFFSTPLQKLGFQTTWIPLDHVQRSGHLVAEWKGSRSKKTVLLIGHLDTVFEKDSAFQKFQRLDEDRVKGPGIYDMKGGIVAMLLSLNALKNAGLLDHQHLIIVLTGDEERAGRDAKGSPLASRQALIDAAKRSDYALGFEPGWAGNINNVTIARRSSTGWTLTANAPPGHSSTVFGKGGAGSIYPVARALDRFRTGLGGRRYLTFNPGLITGGTELKMNEEKTGAQVRGKTNVIARQTVVRGGIRAMSREQFAEARSSMEKIVAAVQEDFRRQYPTDPPLTMTLEFGQGYPPMSPTAGNEALFQILAKVHRDLGLGQAVRVDPGTRGAADISFIAGLVDGALDGLGPLGEGAHSEEEIIHLKSLEETAIRSAVFLHRLQNPSKP